MLVCVPSSCSVEKASEFEWNGETLFEIMKERVVGMVLYLNMLVLCDPFKFFYYECMCVFHIPLNALFIVFYNGYASDVLFLSLRLLVVFARLLLMPGSNPLTK